MKARRLLTGSILSPHQREVVYIAFEAAWEIVKPANCSDDLSIERARLRLAEIILDMEGRQALDTVRIRDEAVRRYLCDRVY